MCTYYKIYMCILLYTYTYINTKKTNTIIIIIIINRFLYINNTKKNNKKKKKKRSNETFNNKKKEAFAFTAYYALLYIFEAIYKIRRYFWKM